MFFFNQKTAYELRISDWSSDVGSSDLVVPIHPEHGLSEILSRERVEGVTEQRHADPPPSELRRQVDVVQPPDSVGSVLPRRGALVRRFVVHEPRGNAPGERNPGRAALAGPLGTRPDRKSDG